jgi:hypothetical protein
MTKRTNITDKLRNNWVVVSSQKNLRKEGDEISRLCIINLMKRLGLEVAQRKAYKVTKKRKHNDAVADNLLGMTFLTCES